MQMNMPQPSTVHVGTIFLELMLPWPWPVAAPFLVYEWSLPDGTVTLIGEPNGRLRVRITDAQNTALIDRATCVFDLPERTVSAFAMAWSVPDDWSAFLNGVHIGSTNPNDSIPDRCTVAPRNSDLLEATDFGKENKLIVARRRDRLAGWQGVPNRVAADSAYLMSAFKDEISQIDDLLTLIEQGAVHHAGGLAARLRAFVVTGRPLPLLQLLAASISSPLIVYTEPRPRQTVFDGAKSSASFSIWSEPKDRDTNPIDLDVWLDLPWGQIGEKAVTHREALKHIADTIGAHVDPDLHEVVVALNAGRSAAEGVNQRVLVLYLTRVARAVVDLARKVTS